MRMQAGWHESPRSWLQYYLTVIINLLRNMSGLPPTHVSQEQRGVRDSSLGPSPRGAWEALWVPGELLESPEGDHGAHPLAQRGEPAVHVELGAMSQQVRIGSADWHGYPAGGWAVGMRPLSVDLAPPAAPVLETSVSQHRSSPQRGHEIGGGRD